MTGWKRMQVAELVRAHPVTVAQDATVSESADLMHLYQTRELPVTDDAGHLCGILTEADIWDFCTAHGVDCKVSEVMTRTVHCVKEQDPIFVALEVFFREGFKCLPVVDDRGVVVGTLSRCDLLVAMFDNPRFSDLLRLFSRSEEGK
ncbi:MAG: CBS domain-containing protein [Chloroherpetonaceae bacterium]|nr:CBS domain-containing protein [Chloroherpetonaceae bacterium]